MDRLTISLPEDLVRRVKRVSEETGLKVSGIVARALQEHLGEEAQSRAEPGIHPTVLWKLKGRRYLRGPSPRLTKARVGTWRVIDLNKSPIQGRRDPT